eukprot:COSAG03_NODE_12375_length_550_cov_0.749446_2_plen_73_part_01
MCCASPVAVTVTRRRIRSDLCDRRVLERKHIGPSRVTNSSSIAADCTAALSNRDGSSAAQHGELEADGRGRGA